MVEIDLSRYVNEATFWSKLRRYVWSWVQGTVFRCSPQRAFGWRRFLLRRFGAKLSATSYIYSTVDIRDPYYLEVGEHSSIGPRVGVYSVDRIVIGDHCTVSMEAMLCTGSHDISHPQMRLTHAPIQVCDGAWVCARAFVGPGVRVGRGAVVAACAVVTRDVADWVVVVGNPAVIRKAREIREVGS